MKRVVVMGAGIFMSCSALAFDAMKAGLWETTMTMDPPAGMPQMSPEQIARMKQMGIDMPFGHPIVNQTCITPEMAEKRKNYQPHMRPEDKCELKDYNATSSSASGTIVCDSNTMRGEGHFSATSNSDSSYSGTWDFNGTTSHGPMKMHATFGGRYLAASCGAVAPVPEK